MSQFLVVVLVVVGALGIWLGFAEDFKLGVLVALAAFGAATFYSFHGGFGPLAELPAYVAPKAQPARQKQGATAENMDSMKLAALIVTGVMVSAVGLWFGFAKDIEAGMLIGVLAAAGATLATFRGKAAF